MTCFFAVPVLLVPGRALADSGIPSDFAGNTDGGDEGTADDVTGAVNEARSAVTAGVGG